MVLLAWCCCTFYKIILTTSAVSSTNLGSILIFASCVVVGTLAIILCGYVGEFFSLNGRGPCSILFFNFFLQAVF